MTNTDGSTNTCAECGQFKPITDRFGHTVQVDSFSPPDGTDDLVMVCFDKGKDDKRPGVLLLTIEMADRLAVKLASIAEADRRFRLEEAQLCAEFRLRKTS